MNGGSLADLDVAVLAGGQATRLQPVLTDLPKILAPIDGRPFIALLLDWLEHAGARRIVLCLGHLADKVEAWLAAAPPRRATIVVGAEPRPLGTAGALGFNRALMHTDPVVVVNGDTIVEGDFSALVAAHAAARPEATILCSRVADISSFGSVEVDACGRVIAFHEKARGQSGPGLVNAGICLLSAALLDRLAEGGAASLEHDVLPRLSHLVAVPHDGGFLDIGTPERLASAAAVLGKPR